MTACSGLRYSPAAPVSNLLFDFGDIEYQLEDITKMLKSMTLKDPERTEQWENRIKFVAGVSRFKRPSVAIFPMTSCQCLGCSRHWHHWPLEEDPNASGFPAVEQKDLSPILSGAPGWKLPHRDPNTSRFPAVEEEEFSPIASSTPQWKLPHRDPNTSQFPAVEEEKFSPIVSSTPRWKPPHQGLITPDRLRCEEEEKEEKEGEKEEVEEEEKKKEDFFRSQLYILEVTKTCCSIGATVRLKSSGSDVSPPTSVPVPQSATPPAVPKDPLTMSVSPTKPAFSKPPPPPVQSTPVSLTSKPLAARPVFPKTATAKPQSVAKPRTRDSSQTRTAAKLAALDKSEKAPVMASAPSRHSMVGGKPLKSIPLNMIPPNASLIDYALHKDACDTDSESDLDDLPDSFSTPEVRTSLPVKGDAVWVKYRSHNYWPSLVLCSNPKSRKLHILFLDDTPVNGQQPGRKIYLKYDKKKILPYGHENKSKFEDEGKSLDNMVLRKKFQAALEKMVDYLTKRALGHIAACKAFLDEPVNSEDDSSAKMTTPSAPLTPRPSDSLSCPTKRKRKKKEIEIDKEEKNKTKINKAAKKERLSAQDVTVAENIQTSRRKKVMTPDERRAMRKERNQPIVDFICSPEMRKYLTSIYSGQTESVRHQMYMQGSSQQRKIQTNSSGPIDDDEQLDKILDHIGKWHQSLTQMKIPNMDYLLWVWLPEAIIYAIQKTKRCGENRAKMIFEKGVKMTKSEHLEIHNQLTKR